MKMNQSEFKQKLLIAIAPKMLDIIYRDTKPGITFKNLMDLSNDLSQFYANKIIKSFNKPELNGNDK